MQSKDGIRVYFADDSSCPAVTEAFNMAKTRGNENP